MSGPRKPPTKAESVVEQIFTDIEDRKGLEEAVDDMDPSDVAEMRGAWIKIIEGEYGEDADEGDDGDPDEEDPGDGDEE